MRHFLSDLRLGVLGLRRARGAGALAILILALGIGATSAIFSVVDSVLLQPLPFPHGGRLAMVYESFPRIGWRDIPFSAPDYVYLSRHAKIFSALAAFRTLHMELSGRGRPERIPIAKATANLQAVLQSPPRLGRWFTPAEDAGDQPVVVLSYGLWQRKFGGSRRVLGESVKLSRKSYTIIGVMPRGFEFPLRGGKYNNTPAQLWIPISFTKAELTGYGNAFNNSVVGRLAPGITLRQASAEAEALCLDFTRRYPVKMRRDPRFQIVTDTQPLQRALTGNVRTLLWLLLAAVGLVLLIGCADIGSLLLARAAARQPEMAMRAALGASRQRLIGQLLTEALVLALTGGALGLLLARAAIGGLLRLAPASLPLANRIALSPSVLIFTFAICLLSTLLFGLAPAWQFSRPDLVTMLKQGGRGGGLGRARHRLLAGLVVGQFALALVLVAAAGLLVASFTRLIKTAPGFQAAHVDSAAVSLPLRSYRRPTEVRAFFRQLLARTAALPGASNAALATVLPLASEEHDMLHIRSRKLTSEISPVVDVTAVAGDYFGVLRTPLLAGRGFGPEDRRGAQLVAIVNQRMAREFWPHQNPIGMQIRVMLDAHKWQTIVGVVSDIKNRAVNHPTAPAVYLPFGQISNKLLVYPISDEFRTLHMLVRSRASSAAVSGGLRRIVARLDSSLPVYDLQTLPQVVRRSERGRRFTLLLFSLFAGLAIALALIGIYGVVTYGVSQRTREFGVRMALGASPRQILALVAGQGLRLALAGMAIGLAGALAAGQLLAGQLYGVSPADPAVLAIAMLLLAGVALAATSVPAWRASRIDPINALHYE